MDTIVSILTILFIIVLLGFALVFGFALLIWFGMFALIIASFVMIKHMWYRWRFTRGASTHIHRTDIYTDEPPSPDVTEGSIKIIEVDFEDISHKKDKGPKR